MQLNVNVSNRSEIVAAIALLNHVLSMPSILPQQAKDAQSSTSPPSLQLDVLRAIAEDPKGSMTSHEVAAKLKMTQPDFAARIRGTGKAINQAQDLLYRRTWIFNQGKRIRVYTITPEGRAAVGEMKAAREAT